ncbi:MAG: AAA family ATPase [Candidatus Peribacteraceae bacterium]|nr:AAA family ATPase [Candidatus Peribacteraceae bacterium]
MPKILLLTGPGAAGKSTIAKMIAREKGFAYLDGDNEDTEFFPHGDQWLLQNRHLLEKAHQKILNKIREIFRTGKNVVVDYIIFGNYEHFIEIFRQAFGKDFGVIVLFPSKEELNKRDKERECWTTGPERIAAVSKEFEGVKDYIGAERFLDTSGQTPKETVTRIFSLMDAGS